MRIVIFTDFDSTSTLVEATLVEADRRPGTEVVAVYTSSAGLLARRRRATSVRRIMGSALRGRRPKPAGRTAAVCRLWGVPLLLVPGGDPNAAAFLDELRRRWDPDLALSYWARTIFGSAWIDTFSWAVNFHDGRLPDHRGVAATAMEVYEGRTSGGYTFHHIDRRIDTGNIILDGTVPLSGRSTGAAVKAKFEAGGRRIGELLDRIEAGEPGRPQAPGGQYTSNARFEALSTVDDPSRLARTELELRVRSLDVIRLPLPGGPGPVSGLGRRRGLGWPRVDTADGPVTVTRVSGFPAAGYVVGRAIRRGLRRIGAMIRDRF